MSALPKDVPGMQGRPVWSEGQGGWASSGKGWVLVPGMLAALCLGVLSNQMGPLLGPYQPHTAAAVLG